MNIFKNIFSESNSDSAMRKFPWIKIESLSSLNEIIVNTEKPSLIFKHSTRCSVSRMVLKQFEKEFKNTDQIDCYYLDLIQFREISNTIANQFSVTHQSPQILLMKNGVCIYNASHSDIDATKISAGI